MKAAGFWGFAGVLVVIGCSSARPPAPAISRLEEPAARRYVRRLGDIEERTEPGGSVRTRIAIGPGSLESPNVIVMVVGLAEGAEMGPVEHPCLDSVVMVERGTLWTSLEGGTLWLEPGDVAFVERRTTLHFSARDGDAEFLQVLSAEAPSGIAACEQSLSRARNLEAQQSSDGLLRRPQVTWARRGGETAIAGGRARVRLLVDSERQGATTAYVGSFEGQPGLEIAEHVHEASEEILLIESGQGTMTIDGEPIEVEGGMVVRIPAGVRHSFSASDTEATRAVQIYSPPGPEERFRAAAR